MKTRYIQLGLLTLCMVGLSNIVSAQTSIEMKLVPTFNTHEEMMASLFPEKLAMQHFPTVKLNEDGTQNVKQLEIDTNKWMQENEASVEYLDASIQHLMFSKEYAKLAVLLTEIAKKNEIENNKRGGVK